MILATGGCKVKLVERIECSGADEEGCKGRVW